MLQPNDKYNQALIEEPQAGAIALYGPRPGSQKIADDRRSRRRAHRCRDRGPQEYDTRNLYKFTLQPKWFILRAMALVLITDELIGLIKQRFA